MAAIGNFPPDTAVMPGNPSDRTTVLTTPMFPSPEVTSVRSNSALPGKMDRADAILAPGPLARTEILHSWIRDSGGTGGVSSVYQTSVLSPSPLCTRRLAQRAVVKARPGAESSGGW